MGERDEEDPGSAAARLARHKERILREWEAQTRRENAAAAQQSTPALLNSLPRLLDQVVKALAADQPEEALRPIERELALEHGAERAETPTYTLEQMIWEYHLLRRVLFAVLEEETPLTTRERDIIWDAIFVAVRTASAHFESVRYGAALGTHTRALADAEARHALLVAAVADYAIFTLDVDGVITTWNPGCARMKQFTSEEAIGQSYEMLYPIEGRRRNEPSEHLQLALVEGRFRGEGLRLKKDGTTFVADVTIVAMYSGGKHVGFGKVVQNLDERKRLLQERDLSRTEADTLRTEQALRERFVAALSHDLRTPLAAATMSAQLITRRPDDSSGNGRLAYRIVSNLERIDEMIRDLLDASRIRAGEPMRLELAECDLTDVAARVRDELVTIHGDRFHVTRTEPLIGYWSADAMRRILENLLANAEKYGDRTGAITVDLREVGERVLLMVHNFGNPIAPEDQLSLFDQFRRTEQAERGAKKGWGLGLTLVRGLAEAQGGIVKVESYASLGTRFTVDVPRDVRRATLTTT